MRSGAELQRGSSVGVALALALGAMSLAGCASFVEAAAPAQETLRLLPAGAVIGEVGAYGAHSWTGIPYAQPPVGDLRWKAARPAARWAGVHLGNQDPVACPQIGGATNGPRGARKGHPAGQEDCLTLDVYAPGWRPGDVPREDERVPVMVWVHGGSNIKGMGGFDDGRHLAAAHDLVVVTINYRLGPFGWFRHAALRDEPGSAEDHSGNFGTLDIVRALEWVRDNISGFGGDPGRVTLFGNSAGGHNVYSLLLSPNASGLFHAAIAQSGGLWMAEPSEGENFVDDPEPGSLLSSNEILAALLVRLGTASDRADAKRRIASMSSVEIGSLLRAQSADDLLRVYASQVPEGRSLAELPNVFRDGGVVPSGDPYSLLEQGAAHRVPLIAGTNRDEQKLWLVFDDAFATWRFGLPYAIDPVRYELANDYLSAMWKATGADEPAAALSKTAPGRVFAYRFDWDEEPRYLWSDLGQLVGAAHAVEVPFVFGNFAMPGTARLFSWGNRKSRVALSDAMMSYWAQFAYEGAPGRGRGGDLPEWLPWTNGQGESRFMVLDSPVPERLRMDSKSLTHEAVLERVAADPRLLEQRDRCEVYLALTGWTPRYEREHYSQVDSEACADFPAEAHPWN